MHIQNSLTLTLNCRYNYNDTQSTEFCLIILQAQLFAGWLLKSCHSLFHGQYEMNCFLGQGAIIEPSQVEYNYIPVISWLLVFEK